MAPAVAIDSSGPVRLPARRFESLAGSRGKAACPNRRAQVVSATAAIGTAGTAQVRVARLAIATPATSPAGAACHARARRAKLAPSKTVSPVPHRLPSTAVVA
jgi:hypothetical protein